MGLLRVPGPRGRQHRGSGVVASAHRVIGFVALSEFHGLGASGVVVPGSGVLCEVPQRRTALLDWFFSRDSLPRVQELEWHPIAR
ncbi:hypothetical protein NDU88_009727 [Pleurodeles waltl]|uniref:Uncharacterized protein n=1 Tax=Pleurodeles waltl TaxID=8319 RepID=A0AAV7QY53_PLEWA|nr:hypothetical protein NDU88_009727 [Pleurodeles waltl]